MPAHVVRGARNGDEGKGKWIDAMVNTDRIFRGEQKIVAVIRPTGGSNAGHSVVVGGVEYSFHMLPSSSMNPNIISAIGNFAFLDPVRTNNEIRANRKKGLDISPRSLKIGHLATLTQPHHVLLDTVKEAGKNGKGSTKRGISQTAASLVTHEDVWAAQLVNKREKDLAEIATDGLRHVNRGIKMGQYGPGSKKYELDEAGIKELSGLWARSGIRLRPYVDDTTRMAQDYLGRDEHILIEGAQGHGLDVIYGKRPYVSSAPTTVPGLLYAAGIGDVGCVDRTFDVAKLVESKVGGGHFVTEEQDIAAVEKLRRERGTIGAEYGTSTGRERNVGGLDLFQLASYAQVGGAKEIAVTKFDCASDFGDTMRICVGYERGRRRLDVAPTTNEELMPCKPVFEEFRTWELTGEERDYMDLPGEARDVIELIEAQAGLPVSLIGIGAEREAMIVR